MNRLLRNLLSGVLAALVLGLALLPTVSATAQVQAAPRPLTGSALLQTGPATPPLQGKDLEQFRSQLDKFLVDMQDVSTLLQTSQYGRDKAKQLTPDLNGSLSAARQSVASLTPDQLTRMQAAFAAYPQWQSAPQTLKAMLTPDVLGRLRALGNTAHGPDGVDPATCDPGPGTPLGITDYYIAEGVALGLDAIMEGFPTDGLTILARIAPIAAYFVAEGTATTLEGLNAVEAECEDAKFQARVDAAILKLDAPVSTRATQASLDAGVTAILAAITAAQSSINTSITNLSTSINTSFSTLTNVVNTRATSIDNAITAVNNNVTAQANSIQTSISNLNANVNVSFANLTTLLNTRSDTIDHEILDSRALALRLAIEENLLTTGNSRISLFQMPSSAGGYLETVRDIVADTIHMNQVAGQGVGQAQMFFDRGNAAYAAHNWKDAYVQYQKAYSEAAK